MKTHTLFPNALFATYLMLLFLMLTNLFILTGCDKQVDIGSFEQGTIPIGLPLEFSLGVASPLEGFLQMDVAGLTLHFAEIRLDGGLNAHNVGWEKENEDLPALFAEQAWNRTMIPVFTYYELLQSNQGGGGTSAEKYHHSLNDPDLLVKYFDNLILLFDKINNPTNRAIVHIEPDLWHLMQTYYTNGNDSMLLVQTALQETGYPGLTAEYSNTLRGFCQFVKVLQLQHAPNVYLAMPVSHDIHEVDLGTTTSQVDIAFHASRVAAFIESSGVRWDILFYNPAGADAGYYEVVDDNSSYWWDETNTSQPSFQRIIDWHYYVAGLTSLRILWWNVPFGNRHYKSCNNTPKHYMDNRAEYFLGERLHLAELIENGTIGMIFGRGNDQCTNWLDSSGDGITNDSSTLPNHQNVEATSVADDGGYFKERAAAYLQNPIALE
jgi:hypothetical protein